MKRMILTVMAIMSLTMTFAENDKVNSVEAANAYNMEFNISSLAKYLDLTKEQAEEVEDIHSEFTSMMLNASGLDENESKVVVENALYRNLSYMRLVLTNKQYHDYLKALNVTFANRGLK